MKKDYVKLKLLASSHTVGEANYHLQFTPKYRKDVFADEITLQACQDSMKNIAGRLNVVLAGIGFGPDHVHLFVSNAKNYSVVELAQRFKGASSHYLRKNFRYRFRNKLWGDSFWSEGYFHRTVGHVNYETMKKYVQEGQSKHWNVQPAKQYSNRQQTTLLQFH